MKFNNANDDVLDLMVYILNCIVSTNDQDFYNLIGLIYI